MLIRETLLFSPFRIGDARPFGNYLIYPLFFNEEERPPYVTLLSAGIKEKVQISEKENAQVGSIEVRNNGELPLLIPNGQALIGAKQNRTPNRDFLIKAGSSSTIDVSCTESGRWRYSGMNDFAPSAEMDPLWIRREKMRLSEMRERSFRQGNNTLRPASLQKIIWDSVQHYKKLGSVDSGTSALHDLVKKKHENLKKERIQFPEAIHGQEGVLVAAHGKPIAMEFFSGAENYARYHKAIVMSLTFERFHMKGSPEECRDAHSEAWLESLNEMTPRSREAINSGENYLLSGKEEQGEMTLLNGSPIHISVIKITAA